MLYRYFVAYRFTDKSGPGNGHAEIHRDSPITDMLDVETVEQSIQSSWPDGGGCTVTDYKLFEDKKEEQPLKLVPTVRLRALWAVYYAALELADNVEAELESGHAYDMLKPLTDRVWQAADPLGLKVAPPTVLEAKDGQVPQSS